MRVLVCGFTGTILGGIETYVLNMNEHMSSECVFDYILEQDYCVFQERIEKRGGKVLYVPKIRKNPLGYLIQYWRLLGEQFNLGSRVFYYQLFSMTKLFPAIMAKMRGYKVVLHAHNNGLQHASKGYVLVHKMGKKIARFFNFELFTNSQLSSDFMFGKRVKSQLIYNAIDTKKFSFDLTTREKIREEVNCGGKTVFGFVGRLVNQKNPIFAIRVFADILKLNPECELWIVGDGVLESQMEEECKILGIEQSVKWLGRRDDVNKLMQGMDLLLQPSLFEGLGIVLIEAQSIGLHAVTSAVVVPEEAKATDLLRFVNLSEPSSTWANICVDMTRRPIDREKIKMPDYYNIEIEAKRLEDILCRLNG